MQLPLLLRTSEHVLAQFSIWPKPMKRNKATTSWDTAKRSASKLTHISTLKTYTYRANPKHHQFLLGSRDNRKFRWARRSHSTLCGASSQAVEVEKTVEGSLSMQLIRLFWSTSQQTKICPMIGFLIKTILEMKWKYQRSTSPQKERPSSSPVKPQAIWFAKTLTKLCWTKTFGRFNSHLAHQMPNRLPNLNPWHPSR